jgi:hypothetical protein
MLEPKEIRAKVLRYWNSGRVLRAWLGQDELFPLAIPVGRPDAGRLLQEFPRVGSWKQSVESGGKCHTGRGYRIEYREVNHRQMGRQRLPQRVVFDEPPDLIEYLGKQREFQRFARLSQDIRRCYPILRGWIERAPLRVLEQGDVWPGLLSVLDFFVANPRPDRYLRELQIPGVDSKFIEANRRILSDLLEQVLPTGLAHHGFERRFGLKYDQPLIRFRLLDPECAAQFGEMRDITLPLDQFQRLAPLCRRLFITENKINGLSFPATPGGMVIFGLGYGIGSLQGVEWLRQREIHYWGDIDTHGFAILSQLRGYFPDVRGFLMDLETLKRYPEIWGQEEKAKRFTGRLDHLSPVEQATYRSLCENRLGENLRLEQERIPFAAVTRWLESLGEF